MSKQPPIERKGLGYYLVRDEKGFFRRMIDHYAPPAPQASPGAQKEAPPTSVSPRAKRYNWRQHNQNNRQDNRVRYRAKRRQKYQHRVYNNGVVTSPPPSPTSPPMQAPLVISHGHIDPLKPFFAHMATHRLSPFILS